MSKAKFWRSAGIGAAVAAAGAYLFDPDRGRTRRAKLADRGGATLRTVRDRMMAKARYQKGVARGMAHKMTEPFQEPVEVDDQTLLQKIRSEAVGRWQGPTREIEIDVRDGDVTVRGPADRDRAGELIHLIESVDGVRSVSDQMTVTQGI
jgi:osmotically-inducible protein OsmY